MAPKEIKIEGDSAAAKEARIIIAGSNRELDGDAIKSLPAAVRQRVQSAMMSFSNNNPANPLATAYNGASGHDQKRQILARYTIEAGEGKLSAKTMTRVEASVADKGKGQWLHLVEIKNRVGDLELATDIAADCESQTSTVPKQAAKGNKQYWYIEKKALNSVNAAE